MSSTGLIRAGLVRAGLVRARWGRACLALGLVCGLGSVALTLPVSGPLVPAAHAAEGTDCAEVDVDTEAIPVRGPNTPYDRLQVAEAQEWLGAHGFGQAGAGVDIVVVDAGVPGASSSEVAPGYGGEAALGTGHGAVVAGIAAGAPQPADDGMEAVPVGLAPGARVHSMRVYEAMGTGDGTTDVFDPTVQVLADGLTRVAGGIRAGVYGARTVVLVPFALAPVQDLRGVLKTALRDVERAGGLVIASVGDRPPLTSDEVGEAPVVPPREDAAGTAWPAAFPEVIAVGVDPGSGAGRTVQDVVAPNSDIDLVAPAGDGVSRGLNGAPCFVPAYSADWAAAAVAGVAALVWGGRPGEDAAALRARLEQTADGNGSASGRFAGYGVVQPVAALERREGAWLEPAARDRADQRQAPAPVPPADLLAVTRRDAVWWGLIGFGALVVAIILRPVLARRRAR